MQSTVCAALASLIVMTATCANPAGPDADRVQTGQWGGQHVAMQVTNVGAELEFDCAHGRIDEPLTLDRSGAFDVAGTYVREQPGPAREDDQSAQRVRYQGKVNGKSMTLTIAGSRESQDVSSTFTLEHGREPAVRKCY